jgi:caffeoyl-CoA O-methyltransferase
MIDEQLSAYAAAHTTPELPVLAQLNHETHLTQVYPQMLAGHIQGAFLRMVVQMIRPDRVLEIGTFTGYSAISMAMGMIPLADAPANTGERRPLLHTIEVNPELEDNILRYIREANLEKQVIVHIGSALEIIPTLSEIWDLVFIDADKPNYLNYYSLILPRVRPGGFIIADNVLWSGKVTGDQGKMDKDTRGIIEFNDFVQRDERVENLLLQIRDGLMVIRKKN